MAYENSIFSRANICIDTKQIVKKLVAAKKKTKNAPMITKLVLQGPKIYGTLLAELKKSEIGKTLTYLRFENVKTTAQTKLANSLPDLLRSLPLLEELYLPQSLAVDGSLHTTVHGRRQGLVQNRPFCAF